MDRSLSFGSIIYDLNRPIQTRFRFGSVPYIILNLAIYNNSLDRSTKSTTSHLNVLCLLVNIGFQVLFHSPPGVLFNFPSRYFFTIGYQLVFSLTEWSPLFPTRFLVSRGTLDTALLLSISDTGLSPSLAGLPRPFSYQLQINYAVLTPKNKFFGLGSFPFARRYLGNRCFFLFLRVLRCFSSPGSLC